MIWENGENRVMIRDWNSFPDDSPNNRTMTVCVIIITVITDNAHTFCIDANGYGVCFDVNMYSALYMYNKKGAVENLTFQGLRAYMTRYTSTLTVSCMPSMHPCFLRCTTEAVSVWVLLY